MTTKYGYELAFDALDRKDYGAVLELALRHATAGDRVPRVVAEELWQSFRMSL